MNGWARLYIVIAAATIGLSTAYVFGTEPDPEAAVYVPGCDGFTYYTPSQARAALKLADWKQDGYQTASCKESLESIGNGAAYQAEFSRWRDTSRQVVIGSTVFLLSLFAVGAAIGWVWRGFFPRKS